MFMVSPSAAPDVVTVVVNSRRARGSETGAEDGGDASAAGDLPTLPTAQAWLTTPRTTHATISFVEFLTMV